MNNISIEICQQWAEKFLCLAWYLAVVAAICGALYTLVEVYAKYQATKAAPVAKSGEDGGGAIDLTPLKDLIEALTKAPAWFALLIAALGLIWAATSMVPELCRPNPPAAAAKADAKKNEQPAAVAPKAGAAASEDGG